MTASDVSSRSGQRPRLLIRSLWQDVNIGDVAHAPGTLRAFSRWAPEADLVLWARSFEPRERALLQEHLPHVAVVQGDIGDDGQPTPALAAEFDRADLLIHGPGAGVHWRELDAWRRRADRPFGIFGDTVDPISPPASGTLDTLRDEALGLPPDHLAPLARDVLDAAAFVFCRDSISLEYLRRQKVSSRVLEFGPDATFAYDLVDRAAAARLLAEFGLESGEFLCVVPRDRYTPYFRIRGHAPSAAESRREAVSARWRTHDNGQLAELINRWVRETGKKVLLCPEMVHEVQLGADHVLPQIDPAVRDHVAWLSRYWGVDEAAAVYAHARAVVSVECHSPILAITSHTPAVYFRQPTDTIKGQMYADLGMPHAVAEIENGIAPAWSAALRSVTEPEAARAEAAAGRQAATEHLEHMVRVAMRAIDRDALTPEAIR
jgi:polysaccharide pyruvyl transferase WcaK-like protein